MDKLLKTKYSLIMKHFVDVKQTPEKEYRSIYKQPVLIYQIETEFDGPYKQNWLYLSLISKSKPDSRTQNFTRIPFAPDAVTVAAEMSGKFKRWDVNLWYVKENLKDCFAWEQQLGGKYNTIPGHYDNHVVRYVNYRDKLYYDYEMNIKTPERGEVLMESVLEPRRCIEECVVVTSGALYGGVEKVYAINFDKNIIATAPTSRSQLLMEDAKLVPFVMGRMVAMTYDYTKAIAEFEIPLFYKAPAKEPSLPDWPPHVE